MVIFEILFECDYCSGLVEVIKYGVIFDEDFFGYFEEYVEDFNQCDFGVFGDVVVCCCQLKVSVVEQDECEMMGFRVVLNYGYIFVYVYEVLVGYGEFFYGEVVLIGMIQVS